MRQRGRITLAWHNGPHLHEPHASWILLLQEIELLSISGQSLIRHAHSFADFPTQRASSRTFRKYLHAPPHLPSPIQYTPRFRSSKWLSIWLALVPKHVRYSSRWIFYSLSLERGYVHSPTPEIVPHIDNSRCKMTCESYVC